MTTKRSQRKAKALPEGALIRVLWLDADSGPGSVWTDTETALTSPPTVIDSVGWKVGARKPYLVLASDRGDGFLGGITRIPLKWVVSIEEIG